MANGIAQSKTQNGIVVVASPYIVGQITQHKRTKAEIKLLEEQIKAIDARLQEYMGDAEILVDSHRVELATWKAHFQARFNTTKFKAAYPDLYEEFATSAKMRPFKVK